MILRQGCRKPRSPCVRSQRLEEAPHDILPAFRTDWRIIDLSSLVFFIANPARSEPTRMAGQLQGTLNCLLADPNAGPGGFRSSRADGGPQVLRSSPASFGYQQSGRGGSPVSLSDTTTTDSI